MENGITKSDLKSALTEFKTELKTELRMELKTEFRTELKTELAAGLTGVKDELMAEMRQIETNLLTEFHRYGKGQQIRLRALEVRDSTVTERLAIIEERLLHLEARRPPSV